MDTVKVVTGNHQQLPFMGRCSAVVDAGGRTR